MKRILLAIIITIALTVFYGYYQMNFGMMGEVMQWLAGSEVAVDLSGQRPPEDGVTIERGQLLFAQHCSICHGEIGDGKSVRSVDMELKPRDLAGGIYKFRTTLTGSLPTDADIYSTISRGIRGTGMLPWFGLSSEDKWAVTYFIKTLSERFEEEDPDDPIVVPELPPVNSNLVDRGKKLFEQVKCWECHGRQGKGDGPKANELKNDWGQPVKPRGFATESFKRGSNIQDIYISITTGLDGTPMASYGDAMSDEDRLAVAGYVNSVAMERPVSPYGMMDLVPITHDEHAGIMMAYPGMPVGLMRYGMIKLYSE